MLLYLALTYMATPNFPVLSCSVTGGPESPLTPQCSIRHPRYLTPLDSLALQKGLPLPLTDPNFRSTALIYLSFAFFCKKGHVEAHRKAGQCCSHCGWLLAAASTVDHGHVGLPPACLCRALGRPRVYTGSIADVSRAHTVELHQLPAGRSMH